MGLWTLEAKFREFDFESKVTIEENCSKYAVVNIDFADMSKPEHFESCGRMMINLSDILQRLNKEGSE